ncbi:MAG: hypothetical protein IJR82_02830 [Bacilli bacterium]|nr:hypothetical protein [Bacilli bacterium]
MQSNYKLLTDNEINECLLKLSEVLKLYLPSVKEEEISQIIELVRCGIRASLKQSAAHSTDLRFFIGSLASGQYAKYKLSDDEIKQIDGIVASSDLLTKIGEFAKNRQNENIDLFVPPVELTMQFNRITLRDDAGEYLYSSDGSQKGKNM